MFTWQIGCAIGVVLLVAFIWWLNRTRRSEGIKEIDEGLKRSAETWKERRP
jgi:hypothetical protein